VIKLYPDNREEVVQEGLSPIEAKILCAAKIEDLPRRAPAPSDDATVSTEPVSSSTKNRQPRQLGAEVLTPRPN
jgi:hypothetical protein